MGTTSKRIQKAMELRGLKQTDLVEKTGIRKGALSSYISGRYSPKQNNTFLIAKALNVNEAWLDVYKRQYQYSAALTNTVFCHFCKNYRLTTTCGKDQQSF